MKKNTEAMQLYKKTLEKDFPESKKDQEYYIKKAAVVVTLAGDKLAVVEKEGIKTSFWFGEGMYTPMEEAIESCRAAETNSNYFIYQNMKNLESWLESMEDSSLLILGCPCYRSEKRISISVASPYEWEYEKWRFNPGTYVLSDEDRAAYKGGILQAIELRRKRLNTYLKKYGLNHITAGTYWEDR